MTAIKKLTTDPAVLDQLKKSANKHLTANELLEQKVSFIYGSMKSDSNVTREHIRRILAEESGTTG